MSKFFGCSSRQLVCSHARAGRGTKVEWRQWGYSLYIHSLCRQTDTPSTDRDETVRVACYEDAKYSYMIFLFDKTGNISRAQQNWPKPLWITTLCTFLYIYRSMKSSRKLLPFLKAPATDSTTTFLSRTSGAKRTWANASVSRVKEWSSLHTLTIWTGPGSLPIFTKPGTCEDHTNTTLHNAVVSSLLFVGL